MKTKRMMGCALVAVFAAGGLALTGGTAGADVEGVLVSCNDGSSGTDIGDAKIAPGLTTVEKKQTISGTLNATGCTANEAELDEIASESKFGVAKTAAGGRPNPIAKGTAKFKFTTYGDCLGILIADPDDTGEYRPYGTLSFTWLTAGGGKAATSTVFATLDVGIAAGIEGIVTKGLGVGGNFTASAGFLPKAGDDTNGDGAPDFVQCVAGDPTAVGKLVDVTTPASMTIELPVTP